MRNQLPTNSTILISTWTVMPPSFETFYQICSDFQKTAFFSLLSLTFSMLIGSFSRRIKLCFTKVSAYDYFMPLSRAFGRWKDFISHFLLGWVVKSSFDNRLAEPQTEHFSFSLCHRSFTIFYQRPFSWDSLWVPYAKLFTQDYLKYFYWVAKS